MKPYAGRPRATTLGRGRREWVTLESQGQLTLLLSQWGNGDEQAGERAMELVYGELKRVASAYMRSERADHTLQPTALVNEAFLRLAHGAPVEWNDRSHFLRLAARSMRRVLTDHARRVKAAKRGGGAKESLEEVSLAAAGPDLVRLLALDEVLGRLARLDPRQAQVVELRFFAGLTVAETADVLDLSPVTVKRDWRCAKAWLKRELARTEESPDRPNPT